MNGTSTVQPPRLRPRQTRWRHYAVILPLALACSPAWADMNAACTTLAQAAASGMAAQIAADDQTIKPPTSISQLSCLDKFFSGAGLDVITNLLNPGNLLSAIEGQVCAAALNTWQSYIGAAQCGLTVTGFNMGFSGLGGGVSCPKLSFGGGGGTLGSVGTGLQPGQTGVFITGTGVAPTGYNLPSTNSLW